MPNAFLDPDLHGRLWTTAIADKARLGRWTESIIERFYTHYVQPGDRVADVGANVGRHTLPLAERVGDAGHVHAYEPILTLSASLQDRIAKSPYAARITLKQAAVSDVPGTRDFHYIKNQPAMSGLMIRPDISSEAVREQYKVDCLVLDQDLAGLKPSFVKIDVEGAEYLVFKGAANLMATARPVFAFEDGRYGSAMLYKYTLDEFYKFFEQAGYEIYDIFGFCVDNKMSAYGGPWNFFAGPKENAAKTREAIAYSAFTEIMG